MEWKSTDNAHVIHIKEIMQDSYFALQLSCDTCNLVLGTFSQKAFPKYRIAYKTAWRWGHIHSNHAPWPHDLEKVDAG